MFRLAIPVSYRLSEDCFRFILYGVFLSFGVSNDVFVCFQDGPAMAESDGSDDELKTGECKT